ncbi:hypothetical protein ACIPIU_28040 [Streptomyces massasporeus]|uniref:DUF7144 family membrane protein n=1 Tax=Streptomyces massasporeus TaxID=67324 RepID=UPI003828A1EC
MTVFAAIMLMIGGILDIVRGIAEIADDDIFVSTRNYVFEFNLTAWGWIHLALGVLAFVVSFGLFMASTWPASWASASRASSSSPTSSPCRAARDAEGRGLRPVREPDEAMRGGGRCQYQECKQEGGSQ